MAVVTLKNYSNESEISVRLKRYFTYKFKRSNATKKIFSFGKSDYKLETKSVLRTAINKSA